MRYILFISILLSVLFITTPAFSESTISSVKVKTISSYGSYIKYSWKAVVYSDRQSECALTLSFRDSEGFEIHMRKILVNLSKGSNHLTGQNSCDKEIWKNIQNYTSSIYCW